MQSKRQEAESPLLPFGKTSVASSVIEEMHSASFSKLLPSRGVNYAHQGDDGKTLVMCIEAESELPGAFSTLNFSECPSDAVESTLSSVLEASVPVKYCLTAQGAQGILNRAARRNVTLPDYIRTHLEFVALS